MCQMLRSMLSILRSLHIERVRRPLDASVRFARRITGLQPRPEALAPSRGRSGAHRPSEDVPHLGQTRIAEREATAPDQGARRALLNEIRSGRPPFPLDVAEVQEGTRVVERLMSGPRHEPSGDIVRRPAQEHGLGVAGRWLSQHEASSLDAFIETQTTPFRLPNVLGMSGAQDRSCQSTLRRSLHAFVRLTVHRTTIPPIGCNPEPASVRSIARCSEPPTSSSRVAAENPPRRHSMSTRSRVR